MEEIDRAALLEGLAAGDDAAWRLFVREFGGLIYDAPARLGIHGTERDDIFQNVCLAVYRSIGSLRDPASLATWLYGIAYRQSVNVLRRGGRELLSGPDEDQEHEFVSGDPSPDRELAALEEAGMLRDSLDLLDPRCRRLLAAIYLEDPPLSYQEITERHGMPTGSIGPTRARCLKKLRDRWDKVSTGRPRATTG